MFSCVFFCLRSVVRIDYGAFRACDLAMLVLPTSVTYLGQVVLKLEFQVFVVDMIAMQDDILSYHFLDK